MNIADMEFDLCIIGAGMIGSCAAHHASKLLPPNSKICLIGPDEPKDRNSDPERSIFGAYYDEGRMARNTGTDWVWAELGRRSILNYNNVEQESGIKFFSEVGSLTVLHKKEDVSRVKTTIKRLQKPIYMTTWKDLKTKPDLKYFNFDDEDMCVVEYQDAGYVNPRLVVAAYQKIAVNQGCHRIKDIVNNVSKSGHLWSVSTDCGRKIKSYKVLVTTGAFTAFRDVLPRGIKPHLPLKSQTVLFAKVNQHDIIRFRNMPVLLHKTTVNSCYLLPPIRYPDGRYYLKIGHGDQFELDIKTEDEMRSWYQGKAPEEHKEGLWNILHSVLPDFVPVSLHTDICVTTKTPSRGPYIDLLEPTLGVALGGNGHAGKSCDEIGRLAAQLITTGYWTDPEFKQADFMFVASAKL